jgi:hypothetical protein
MSLNIPMKNAASMKDVYKVRDYLGKLWEMSLVPAILKLIILLRPELKNVLLALGLTRHSSIIFDPFTRAIEFELDANPDISGIGVSVSTQDAIVDV